VATPPETSPLDFGAAVQAEARRRGLGGEKVVYLVMDGAVWLGDLADDRLKSARKTLDFHHARDHLWAIAHLLHGQGTPEARAWVQPSRWASNCSSACGGVANPGAAPDSRLGSASASCSKTATILSFGTETTDDLRLVQNLCVLQNSVLQHRRRV
jgi:hypothetical protein